jgi:hypothetical protein
MTENDNNDEENNMTNSSTTGSAGAPRDPAEFYNGMSWGRSTTVWGFSASFALTVTEEETVCWIGTVEHLRTKGQPETSSSAWVGVSNRGRFVATCDRSRGPRVTAAIPGFGEDPRVLAGMARGVARDAHRLNMWNANIDIRRWIATLPGWRPERFAHDTMIFHLWFLGGVSELWAKERGFSFKLEASE